MNILDWQKGKDQQKICMVTCYDYSFAKILSKTTIDTILIGDSVATVVYGYPNTVHATVEMISNHVAAVARGAANKFLVADMPFLSYRKSIDDTLENVKLLMQAGAKAIKLEGCKGNQDTIRRIVDSGVPVMGHLGLTPQHFHLLGGYRVQGNSNEEKEIILKEAVELEKAGCFAVVLECVPSSLGEDVTKLLKIPTIGIGAGPLTDGQVLVLQDLLGMDSSFKPKFLKQYINGADLVETALNNYCREVHSGGFPLSEHVYN